MLTFLPFPPALAEVSAKNAKTSYEGKKRQGDHMIPGVAAYRLPDGSLRQAHDLYAPMYPAGATPGIATLNCRMRHYANETSGYDITVQDFVPAAELLRDNPVHDPERAADVMDSLAVAHVRIGGESGFLWALDEDQMAAWVDALPKHAQITRAVLSRHGLGEGQVASAAFMVVTAGGTEIHVGANADTLADGLRERFYFIDLNGLQGEDVIGKIAVYGRERNWSVDSQVLLQGDAAAHGPGCGCASCMVRSGNDWLKEIIGTVPAGALMRPLQNISIAMIENAGQPILTYGSSPAFAFQQASDLLQEMMLSGQAPSVVIADGIAALPYGGQLRHLAVLFDDALQDPMAPMAFASGTDRNLASLIRQNLEGLVDEAAMAGVRDMIDLADALAETGRFRVVRMETGELAERLAVARSADDECPEI